MSISAKLDRRIKQVNSLLCVGLDSDVSKLPQSFRTKRYPQFEFNKWIIDETHEFVSSYKPNSAFYEARGEKGMLELKMTMDYLKATHPQIVTILDAKRADIGNTNEGYVASIFDWLGFDAVTLHPYLGKEALSPFLSRKDKACIILCKTSNPGAGELQDLMIKDKPLWQIVAQKVDEDWNENHNCMLVVGATYPNELKAIRALLPQMTFLVPGIGAQGGEVKAAITAGKRQDGRGLIVNVSRAIIFSKHPSQTARKLRDEINQYR